MPYLRRITERHQITIPPSLLKQAGIPEGALLSIDVVNKKIVLEPQEVVSKDLSEEDWDKLDKLVKKQTKTKKYLEYFDSKQAKKHLDRFLR